MSKNEKKNKIKEPFINNDTFVTYYGIFHIFLTIASVLMYLKCSGKEGGFNKRSFTFALCCPQVYLIYTIGTKGIGYCFKSGEEEEESSSESVAE